MATVALLNFSKKRNSTLRPPIFTELFQGQIKHDFSLDSLDIEFEFSDPTVPPEYNYAYIYSINRFYFIEGWAFIGGLWQAKLTIDVLATYRDLLKDKTFFCLRSANFQSSQTIDASYPISGGTISNYVTVPAATFWGNSVNNGCVVAGIVGASGVNIGAVTYYAMPYTVFRNFMARLLSNINWAGISTDEISQELQKALINPAQYIVSCVWIPFSSDVINGVSTTSVNLGWWSFTLSGEAKIINSPGTYVEKQVTVSLPKHSSRNNGWYFQLSPYTTYSLKFLPFGVFELDTAKLADYNEIYLTVRANPMNGEAILDVALNSANPTRSILTAQSNIGVQIPTGQISANLANLDQALLAGGIAGAADLVSAFRANANQGTIGNATGGTTVNSSGFSHKSGGF